MIFGRLIVPLTDGVRVLPEESMKKVTPSKSVSAVMFFDEGVANQLQGVVAIVYAQKKVLLLKSDEKSDCR